MFQESISISRAILRALLPVAGGAILVLAVVSTASAREGSRATPRATPIEAADDVAGDCRPTRPSEVDLAFAPLAADVAHRRAVPGSLWLRTALTNPDPAVRRSVVAIWFPYLSEVLLVVGRGDGSLHSERHGATIRRPPEAMPSPVPAFAVALGPGETVELMVCIRSDTIVIAPIRVFDEAGFWRAVMVDAALVFMMLGMIAAALLYALACAITLRQPVFAAFVGFAAAALAYVGLATGHAKLWLWPDQAWQTTAIYGVVQAGLLATGLIFLRTLLRPREVSIGIDRAMLGLAAVAAATAGAPALPGTLRVAAHALVVGIGPLATLLMLLLLWRRGVRHAGAAAIGWGPGLLATLHLYLRVFDLTPYHPLNHHVGPAAVTFACACFAWVLARVIRSAEERAFVDPLTGLWNRRWLEGAVHAHAARCRRTGSPLSIGVFDADFFKHINDRWGHGVGDVVLKHLAARATETLRPSDQVARIGGEEFCILLPGLTAEEAAVALDRVRSTVEATAIGPLPAGAVTISGGVAMTRAGMAPFEALLHAADTALYRAKEAGRNRVEIAPEVTSAAPAHRRSGGTLRPLLAEAD